MNQPGENTMHNNTVNYLAARALDAMNDENHEHVRIVLDILFDLSDVKPKP